VVPDEGEVGLDEDGDVSDDEEAESVGDKNNRMAMIQCQHILSPLGQSLIRPDELVYNLQSMEVQVCQKMEDAALSRLYRGYQDAPDDLWVNELCGSSIRSFLMVTSTINHLVVT